MKSTLVKSEEKKKKKKSFEEKDVCPLLFYFLPFKEAIVSLLAYRSCTHVHYLYKALRVESSYSFIKWKYSRFFIRVKKKEERISSNKRWIEEEKKKNNNKQALLSF